MIDYVEIRSKTTREIIGLIDNAKSIIWHSVYYGVGDFEIYAVASSKNIELLKEGNYITRSNNDEIGIIEKIVIEQEAAEGRMITATGRFAKSILDRRHIYKLSGKKNTPTVLTGNVESAARALVSNNAISCSFDTKRNFTFLQLGTHAGTTETIVDDDGTATSKQVSFANLLEYTDELLQEYKLSSKIILDDATNKLKYVVFKGADRSADNTESNDPVIFSQGYDNLLSSIFAHDISPEKNAALIGGEGEGLDRFYSFVGSNYSGLNRRETFVDASSINKKYEDENQTEQTYTDAEYTKMLQAAGKQQLAALNIEESFEGSILANGIWQINDDYFLGDIVQLQDDDLRRYARVRILEITEVQDDGGYTIDPVFDYEDVIVHELLTSEDDEIITTEASQRIEVDTNGR